MCDLLQDGDGRTLQRKWVKTRKETRCDECYRPIHKGEKSLYHVGVLDGDLFSCRFCRHCGKAIEWLSDHGHGWTLGGIGDDVRYCAEWILEERKKRTVMA